MKFEKLDSKKMPQVIILGVLAVGALGYGAWALVGAMAPPVPPPTTGQVQKVAAVPGPDGPPDLPNGALPGAQPEGQPEVSGLPNLPGTFNPDPFRPAVSPEKPQENVPPVKPLVVHGHPHPLPPVGPEFPGGDPGVTIRSFPGPAFPQHVEPSAPVRPSLVVTGVIDANDGKDMALVIVGADHRVLQTGDVVGEKYRVKKITLTGLVLDNGSDHFFVPLGKKGLETAAAPAVRG